MSANENKKDITSELMSIIDENKEGLQEGLYLKLCNTLKKKHEEEKEEEKKEESFYNIDYVFTCPEPMGERTHKMNIKKSKTIVKLSHENYEKILSDIKRNCFYYPSCGTLCDILDNKFFSYGYMCYDCEECSPATLTKSFAVFRINPA